MTDYILYAKAACISCAALFGIVWCLIGLGDALYACLCALFSILLIAGFVSVAITLTFLFFDWKNRNEESDSA